MEAPPYTRYGYSDVEEDYSDTSSVVEDPYCDCGGAEGEESVDSLDSFLQQYSSALDQRDLTHPHEPSPSSQSHYEEAEDDCGEWSECRMESQSLLFHPEAAQEVVPAHYEYYEHPATLPSINTCYGNGQWLPYYSPEWCEEGEEKGSTTQYCPVTPMSEAAFDFVTPSTSPDCADSYDYYEDYESSESGGLLSGREWESESSVSRASPSMPISSTSSSSSFTTTSSSTSPPTSMCVYHEYQLYVEAQWREQAQRNAQLCERMSPVKKYKALLAQRQRNSSSTASGSKKKRHGLHSLSHPTSTGGQRRKFSLVNGFQQQSTHGSRASPGAGTLSGGLVRKSYRRRRGPAAGSGMGSRHRASIRRWQEEMAVAMSV